MWSLPWPNLLTWFVWKLFKNIPPNQQVKTIFKNLVVTLRHVMTDSSFAHFLGTINIYIYTLYKCISKNIYIHMHKQRTIYICISIQDDSISNQQTFISIPKSQQPSIPNSPDVLQAPAPKARLQSSHAWPHDHHVAPVGGKEIGVGDP